MTAAAVHTAAVTASVAAAGTSKATDTADTSATAAAKSGGMIGECHTAIKVRARVALSGGALPQIHRRNLKLCCCPLFGRICMTASLTAASATCIITPVSPIAAASSFLGHFVGEKAGKVENGICVTLFSGQRKEL